MLRRFAFVTLVRAAGVGDDPISATAPPDAGTTPDSGTGPAVDSGPDGGVPSNDADAGADAAPSCIAPATNMVSWWTGDDTFMDRLSANNMTPTGNTGNVGHAAGHVGNALSFDGTKFLERALPIGIDSLGGFTVEAWVKAGANANQRIVDRSTAGSNDGWFFDFWMTKLRLAIGIASVESKTVMPIGSVLHVAGTFDGSSLRLFVNGVEDNQASASGVTTVPAPNHPLRIGGASDFSARWQGLVDEAAIYSRALTPVEIKAIFDAGASGRCK
jgi:large repetitive protein